MAGRFLFCFAFSTRRRLLPVRQAWDMFHADTRKAQRWVERSSRRVAGCSMLYDHKREREERRKRKKERERRLMRIGNDIKLWPDQNACHQQLRSRSSVGSSVYSFYIIHFICICTLDIGIFPPFASFLCRSIMSGHPVVHCLWCGPFQSCEDERPAAPSCRITLNSWRGFATAIKWW